MINGVAGGDLSMDPIRDAHITPGTFSPQCGLTGTIVMHGGGCKNELGWYNATENPATKPTDAQIYTLVPSNLQPAPPNGLMCADQDFCPLATMTTTQAPQHSWVDYDFAQNIRTSANYKGGLIGLALRGVANSQCPQTKYSQAELNDKNAAGMPWVTTLIYQSVADPQAYYIAFEDLPTCATSWKGCNTQNDGDFNDFVFYVSGLSCNLGGEPCPVQGAMGICAGGITECAGGGMTTTCRQAVMPSPEKCDNQDNDCNGMVDEGDGLCPPSEVCSQGVCRHACDDTEFPCAVGLTCDSTDGLCKDPGCIGKTCNAGQVCQRGVCVGGCDGVTCPHGQTCRLGACVAACDGVTCPSGSRVRERRLPAAVQQQVPHLQGWHDVQHDQRRVRGDGLREQDVPHRPGLRRRHVQGRLRRRHLPGRSGVHDGRVHAGRAAGRRHLVGLGRRWRLLDPRDRRSEHQRQRRDRHRRHRGTHGSGGGGGTLPQRGNISSCSCDTARGPGAGGVALLLAGLAMVLVRRRRRYRARARSSR